MRQFAVRKHVLADEGPGAQRRAPAVRVGRGDAVVHHQATVLEQCIQAPEIPLQVLQAHVFEHADRGDPVKAAVHVAVVLQADLHAALQAGLRDPLSRQLELLVRQRDAHDAGVVRGFVAQPFTKHWRVSGGAGLFLEDGASARVERTGAMPLDGVRFSRGIALAFAGDHVQKLRPARYTQAAECGDQRGQVVAVDGPDVVEAEFFEQRARQHHALQVLFGAARQFPHGGHALQHFLARALDGGVDAASE